jgi:hypothetical protein
MYCNPAVSVSRLTARRRHMKCDAWRSLQKWKPSFIIRCVPTSQNDLQRARLPDAAPPDLHRYIQDNVKCIYNASDATTSSKATHFESISSSHRSPRHSGSLFQARCTMDPLSALPHFAFSFQSFPLLPLAVRSMIQPRNIPRECAHYFLATYWTIPSH